MPTRRSTDQVVDAFVARINATCEHDDRRFRPIESAPWIREVETRLPRPFPPSFRSLVTRYAFAPFEVGPLHLFANTGEPDADEELATRIFTDRVLAKVLLGNGFVQIGWPVGGWYDPVCFDVNDRRGGGEYPLVHLDHEAALQDEEIRIVRRIARSFLNLISP